MNQGPTFRDDRHAALAVVPAFRASSPGGVRVETAVLDGVTLLAWPIAAAMAAAGVCGCVVVSDDERIADVAERFGARAVVVPAGVSGPAAIAQAVDASARGGVGGPAMVAVLHPTAPLRPRGLLDGAVDALREAEAAERVRTVTPIEDGSGLVVRGEGGLLTPAMGDGERGSGVRWVTGHAEVWRVDALRRAVAGGAAPAGVGVEVPRECAVEVTANDALDRAQRAIDRFGHALDLAHPRALARIANEASVLGGGGFSRGGSDTGGRRVDAA